MRVGREVVPDNIVGAAVDLNILGVITFSLMLGVALSTLGAWAAGGSAMQRWAGNACSGAPGGAHWVAAEAWAPQKLRTQQMKFTGSTQTHQLLYL